MNIENLKEQAEALVGVTLLHKTGSRGVVTRACNKLAGGVFVEITYCAAKTHHTVGGTYIWNPLGIRHIRTFDADDPSTADCKVVA